MLALRREAFLGLGTPPGVSEHPLAPVVTCVWLQQIQVAGSGQLSLPTRFPPRLWPAAPAAAGGVAPFLLPQETTLLNLQECEMVVEPRGPHAPCGPLAACCLPPEASPLPS